MLPGGIPLFKNIIKCEYYVIENSRRTFSIVFMSLSNRIKTTEMTLFKSQQCDKCRVKLNFDFLTFIQLIKNFFEQKISYI